MHKIAALHSILLYVPYLVILPSVIHTARPAGKYRSEHNLPELSSQHYKYPAYCC